MTAIRRAESERLRLRGGTVDQSVITDRPSLTSDVQPSPSYQRSRWRLLGSTFHPIRGAAELMIQPPWLPKHHNCGKTSGRKCPTNDSISLPAPRARAHTRQMTRTGGARPSLRHLWDSLEARLRYGPAAFGLTLLDPRSWMHGLRILHYYSYSHVRPRARASIGHGARIAPNVSFRNGERVRIGAHAHVGANCSLWAGDSVGRITLGDYALLGPEVFITASNYSIEPGTPVMHQPKLEEDVAIGRDVWLGAKVTVLPGVQIGDGCVIGAGSVVTRSLGPGTIAVGNPARAVGHRSVAGVGDPKERAAT